MTLAEIIDEVQYVVDHQGKVTAVVLAPELWQRVVDVLDDAEDRTLVKSIRERLVQGPIEAGALRWQDVKAVGC